MAMSENTVRVLNYLKEANGANVTAGDVAADLGLNKKTVDGCFTAGLQRKNLGVRVPAEVEMPDGTVATVKFLKLTAEGMAFDPSADTDAE